MKIAFSNIANNEIPFDLNLDGLNFSGKLKRIDSNLVQCLVDLKGKISHICDRCGDDINLSLDQNIDLILSNGIYKNEEENLVDVVEFFDGFVDLQEVLVSEIEAYKSDYFYCEKCKNL
ncbi:MAG: hypothetical protein ACTTJC_03560 [Campylobacter sp.]